MNKFFGIGVLLLAIGLAIRFSYRQGARDGQELVTDVLADSAAQLLEQRDSIRAAYDDSLAQTDSVVGVLQRRAYRYKQQADTLTRALARAREDDDSIPLLTRKLAAKDSVIVADSLKDLERVRAIALLRAERSEQDTTIARMHRVFLQVNQEARRAILAARPDKYDYLGLASCAVAGYGAGAGEPVVLIAGAIGCMAKTVIDP